MENVGFVVFQLIKDRRAPDGPVHPFDGQREQEVALQAGPQDTGIQERGEHPPILSGRSISTAAFRDNLPGFA